MPNARAAKYDRLPRRAGSAPTGVRCPRAAGEPFEPQGARDDRAGGERAGAGVAAPGGGARGAGTDGLEAQGHQREAAALDGGLRHDHRRRALLSRIVMDGEMPPLCAASSPSRLATDEDPTGGCVITILDDGKRAAITVAGSGIGGTPARARALLDELVGSR